MPAGRTHDRITVWSLPLVAGLTFAYNQNGNLTLLVCGAFLFGGLMFGPDLDVPSRQFRRWGWLRWIWLPYQKSIPHRSFLSHGPLIGTAIRLAYLGIWGFALAIAGLGLASQFWKVTWSWGEIGHTLWQSLQEHRVAWFALWVGLELGAMSHSLSDWSSSLYKRLCRSRKNAKPKH